MCAFRKADYLSCRLFSDAGIGWKVGQGGQFITRRGGIKNLKHCPEWPETGYRFLIHEMPSRDDWRRFAIGWNDTAIYGHAFKISNLIPNCFHYLP